MTAKELKKKYIKATNRIKYANKRIEHEQQKECDVVSVKVTGSSDKYPYLPIGVSVEAENPQELSQSRAIILKWKREIERNQIEKTEIEEKIDTIPDVEVRDMMWRYCIEGKTHSQVGAEMGFTRTNVTKKLNALTFT